jgi:phosphate transport system substrate-binding protein
MRIFWVLFAITHWATLAFAQDLVGLLKSMPPYQPHQQVTGIIRIWGEKQMQDIVNQWEVGFGAREPGVRFETNLRGAASAIGGVYTGAADIALTDGDFSPGDVEGFEETFQYKPFRVEACTGSLDVRNGDSALVVFVHKDNPLSHLTLAQVDAIFDGDLRRGSKVIRTWGDLGLKDGWASMPIHTYGYSPRNREFARFFEDAVMAGSRKWNCDLHGFSDHRQPNGSLIEAGQQIVDAVAKDRYSIGYSSLLYRNRLAKSVALAPAMTKDRYGIRYSIEMYKHPVVKSFAPEDVGPYFEPTKNNLIQRNYPLTRTVSMIINRIPGGQIKPVIKEFLRYVLSREGQNAVAHNGEYLPLNKSIVMDQRRKLE